MFQTALACIVTPPTAIAATHTMLISVIFFLFFLNSILFFLPVKIWLIFVRNPDPVSSCFVLNFPDKKNFRKFLLMLIYNR